MADIAKRKYHYHNDWNPSLGGYGDPFAMSRKIRVPGEKKYCKICKL